MAWKLSQSLKELRGFLELSGYYRRFIKGYGSIAKPLIELLKKESWSWSPQADQAFMSLKFALSFTPVLALPNFQVEFYIDNDASSTGMGAILQQMGHPIAYFKKALGIKHQSLSIYLKEMLVALLVVKKWHSYLVRRHFCIKTDHQSLKFLSNK